MKILVLSDSHGNLDLMWQAYVQEQPDVVLHLGDYERDAMRLEEQIDPTVTFCCVSGNCDSAPSHAASRTVSYEGYRFFMTHGHPYQVKYSLLRLSLAAQEAMADVVLFGHTHQALCMQENGMWLLNPGSCSGVGPATYGLVEIEDGILSCRIAHLTPQPETT